MENDKHKKQIISRTNRVSGQVKAISKMIDDDRSCNEIAIQFQAAKTALDRAYAEFLKTNLETCLLNKDKKTLDLIIKNLTSR